MGIIRGGVLILVAVILFLIVLLGCVFYTLSLSLEYENVQKEFKDVARNLTENKFLGEENFNLTLVMENARNFMILHCQNETSYVFTSGGYTFVMPCSLLEEGNQSIQEFVDVGVENIIYDIYYKDYNCDFWNCLSSTEIPLFLISEKAKNYWQEKFYFSLIIFAILVVLVLFLVEQKQNIPILIGTILILSSLLLLKIEELPVFLLGEYYSKFITVFFSKISTVFLISFILGIVLLIIGISLRLLQKDSLKKKFSKEDVKNIVKDELNNEKKLLSKKIPIKKLPKRNK